MGFPDAIFAINKLKKFISAGTPCVKQVASGTHTFTSQERNGVTITTGVTVNPEKTVVLLNSSISNVIGHDVPGASAHWDTVQSVLTDKTATTITLSACYGLYSSTSTAYVYGTVSWQLIEFY